MKRLPVLGLMASLLVTSSAAWSQEAFPDRPVRVLVSAGAGGGTDIVTRLLAQSLSAAWKQPAVVENRTGAGGNIAGQLVARAKPDGYTLLASFVGTITMNPFLYKEMGFDPIKQLSPIAKMSSTPLLVVVNPQAVPAKNLKEFLAMAHASQHPVNWASTAKGGGDHLAGELFGMMANLRLNHIPYKGGADALADVLAGRVTFGMLSIPTTLSHLRSGQIVALGSSGKTRLPLLPNVPTIAEGGVPGYESDTWYGLWAPAGTPQAVIDRIAAAVREAQQSETVRSRILDLGMEPGTETPAQLVELIQRETAKNEKTISAIGLAKQ